MPLYLLFLWFLMLPVMAQASSPISYVGGTKVNEGSRSVDFRFGYTTDNETPSNDDRFQMRQHFEAGLTDWYAIRLGIFQDERPSDNMEHSVARFENRIQLIERRESGWDGGIRLLYNHRDHDKRPSEVEFRLMAEVPLGDGWEYRHNTIFEHDVGAESVSGLRLELRHQIARKFAVESDYLSSMKMGLDIFNNMGRIRNMSGYHSQNNQIGALFEFHFHRGYSIISGYRTGISSNGTDNAFALSLTRSF